MEKRQITFVTAAFLYATSFISGLAVTLYGASTLGMLPPEIEKLAPEFDADSFMVEVLNADMSHLLAQATPSITPSPNSPTSAQPVNPAAITDAGFETNSAQVETDPSSQTQAQDTNGSESEDGRRFAQTPEFDREAVLNDFDNRIDDEFNIPAQLRDRVGFWFDVYTKYDSERRVIHHGKYPWIIFKVVDVSPIIFSDTPKRRWMRNQKADKLVKEEANKIRAALRSLAKRKTLNNLNEYEKLVMEALSKLSPKSIQKESALASGEVRIQTGQKNYFMDGLEVSPRYLPTMERTFKLSNLPVELTRIPFVESSFNKHATSKVGASGIWQFMGYTGRKFMIVNSVIDERRSPFKATEAAARLLKENHLILHRSWPLAITAWNHGPGGVRKAIRGSGSKDLGVIVSRYRSRSFDFASSNFYSEFLAALHAERYNKEIYGELKREAELDLHAVKLPRAFRLGEIIRVSGMVVDEFLSINPELRQVAKHTSLPKGFKIHVPAQARPSIERLLAEQNSRPERSSQTKVASRKSS